MKKGVKIMDDILEIYREKDYLEIYEEELELLEYKDREEI